MIQENYCSYEICKLLKKKGFDEPCRSYFSDNVDSIEIINCTDEVTDIQMGVFELLRPTQAMACAWLREKGFYISPKYQCFCGVKKKDKPYYLWKPRVLRLSSGNIIYPQPLDIEYYRTYEETVEAALKYALENLM